MTRPVHLADLARAARRCDQLCRDHPLPAMAELLAARGWPSGHTSTSTERPDGDVSLTSVEAAAIAPSRWVNVDQDLAAAAKHLRTALELFNRLAGEIAQHGDPEAAERRNRQPGAGPCMACGKQVPGTQNDRLRAGFCDACRKRWERQGRPDRPAFIRRTQLAAEAAAATTVTVDPTVPTSPGGGHGDTVSDLGVVDGGTTRV